MTGPPETAKSCRLGSSAASLAGLERCIDTAASPTPASGPLSDKVGLAVGKRVPRMEGLKAAAELNAKMTIVAALTTLTEAFILAC
mmetsp:Transcript_39448/g.69370  ORF Transcript_39448/g.69370 Transcript_39448/m.69370 type:complete len:86 (+) Transcript_39448:424-681(+)